jgi:protein phosphatase PTC1
VTEDQEAVNLVREMPDAQQMAKFLLEHAMAKFSSDNVTVMVIRFKGAKEEKEIKAPYHA